MRRFQAIFLAVTIGLLTNGTSGLALPHVALAQGLDEAERLNEQADQLIDQGRYTEAEPLYKRSLAIKEKKRVPIIQMWVYH